jgi:RimJ/RimL family protein N-acetyltransferase
VDLTTPVTLALADVALVPLRPEHAAGLASAAADGGLWRLRFTSVPEPGEEAAYVATALATPDRVPFAVLRDGTVVGTTSLHDVLPAQRRVEIGYTWYAARVQRTHVNTTCKLLLLRHAFGTLGCATVGWRTSRENHAAQRAIERLGARRDGVLRGVRLGRDGDVGDTVMYSLTAPEWREVERRLVARLGRGARD